MMKKNKPKKDYSIFDPSTLKNAFLYSVSGFKFMMQERAFKQELLLSPIAIILTIAFGTIALTPYLLLLFAECVNTCIETIVDRISSEYHDLSKKAKDIGSFAVMITQINLACVWTFQIWLFIKFWHRYLF